MDIHDIHNISTTCTRTEFVGTAVLDTIGLVISGVDDSLLQQMNVGTKYHCLGLFSSRTGAAGQITAIDDAVKATNTEVLSIELPRDTKGWGGHGNYVPVNKCVSCNTMPSERRRSFLWILLMLIPSKRILPS